MNFFSSGHIMSVVETSKFYKGLKIIYEDDLWEIIEFQHRVMQQRAPVVKTKLKNIFTGLVQEKVSEVVILSVCLI